MVSGEGERKGGKEKGKNGGLEGLGEGEEKYMEGGGREREKEGGRHKFTRAVYILTSLNIHWLLSCLLTAPHNYCIRL